MDTNNDWLVRRRTRRTNPEGMLGLSLGFQPQVLIKRASRPEGGGRNEAPKNTPSIKKTLRPFRACRDWGAFLGLKPQAESYYPFGISSLVPVELTAIHKIDSISLRQPRFDAGDENQASYEWHPNRLLKSAEWNP
jgi:hypothetical protein